MIIEIERAQQTKARSPPPSPPTSSPSDEEPSQPSDEEPSQPSDEEPSEPSDEESSPPGSFMMHIDADTRPWDDESLHLRSVA